MSPVRPVLSPSTSADERPASGAFAKVRILSPPIGASLAVALGVGGVMVLSRTLARWTAIPYPVFLVVAGAGAGFVPGMGKLNLDPHVVFLGFLPPLVYHAGIVISPRDLRKNAVPIGLGALGLVLATTFAVGAVAGALVPALGAGAFVLGAVVAPTDPVAAVSVFERLGVGSNVSAILEGESLVNDGIALALFTIGVAGVGSRTGLGQGLLEFVRVAGGGTAFGLAVGWLASRVRQLFADPLSQIVFSLLIPFAAYLPADGLGLSGVLATLAAGLLLGERPVSGLGASGRLRMNEFWDVLVFLLESVLFVLVGLQLRQLLHGVAAFPAGRVALLAASCVVTVVAIRVVWWLVLPTVRWRPDDRRIDTGSMGRGERLTLGWAGPRGAISLAAALSVPSTVSGHRFPGRDLLVFTTFCVIVATLVGQGTTLPLVLRWLGMSGTEQQLQERGIAERGCAEAALRAIDALAADERISEPTAEVLRARYERRLARADELAGKAERAHDEDAMAPRQLERRLVAAQRDALSRLHRDGEISSAVARQIRRELDLELARFES